MSSNVGEMVESISPKDTHREFLFLDELQQLANTKCESEVVKKASLFSVLTGLRFSDINTLEWSELRGSAGNRYIQFSTDKTGSAEFLPFSDQAYALLEEKGNGKVFQGLKYYLVDTVLPDWLKEAGIDKHITFHCFRHTFATLQLVLGTDIVTVSKLLGHRDIKTTMIYVKIVDKLKRDASHRIKLNISGEWLLVA
ncbi:site-specific integrase [Dyadobacter sp. LHD-138]|uniref:site-specific integrase n=1 Tax=Dyadobacter sp. LHD-138 TaxID=3071413 RepID=UPI0027E0F0C4|nr:site-specific integrase [Dyadobacter sp. LHD-138]MDQ6481279.1 site-specific integrase [Dyadobacter sp. LHD-138]